MEKKELIVTKTHTLFKV